MQKIKHQSSANPTLKGILRGFIAGITCFIISTSICSLVILKNEIRQDLFFIFVLICAGISSFFCALITASSVKKSRLIFALASAVVLLITEFTVLLCFNNASLSVKVYLIVPVMILFAVFGGIIGSNLRLK